MDLVKADVSDEFKTNMAINIILGENMRRSTIEMVAGFFKLDNEAQEQLISSTVGEGLLRVRDQTMHVRFKPSKHGVVAN